MRSFSRVLVRAATTTTGRFSAVNSFPAVSPALIRVSFHSTPILRDATVTDAKIKSIGEQIMQLNMIEVQQLAEFLRHELKLPEGFGVPMLGGGGHAAPAAAPAGDASAAAEAAAPAAAKTEFSVKLKSFGAEKVKVIKEVRTITGLGLKEAKDLVDSAPCDLKAGVSQDEANKIKELIEKAGGEVVIS